MNEDCFITEEFITNWMNTCIECWYDQFHGINYTKPFEEIIFLHSNMDELERYISTYEEKYGDKLTYRLDKGCSYVSQIK